MSRATSDRPATRAARGDESAWHGQALILHGRSAYHPTWDLQRAVWRRRLSLELPDTLILVEHDPVITLGRHADAGFLRLGPGNARSAADRPEMVRIDRGGEVTYHGPGQLTAYLIADLRAHDLGVRRFMTGLEEAVIRTLAEWGIAAGRRAGLIGVWTRGGHPAKIAAAGVRIERGVSRHGIALNVGDCLDGFGWMVPCGLKETTVTSMEHVLGAPVDQAGVARALIRHVGAVFDLDLHTLSAPGPREPGDAATLVEHLARAAGRGARKPAWLRMELPRGAGFAGVRRVLRQTALPTVCEEAACPNRQECWASGTATFMILGTICTRRCRFCGVTQGSPRALQADEPARVGRAAARLGLRHVVVTSVTRDDLPDGGAAHFAATIREVRARLPAATVEVLVPDFGGGRAALETVLTARPNILNHNVESVPRLYPHVRPVADYARSLQLLRRAALAGVGTKSGLMIGLGESRREVSAVLSDLRRAGCQRVTIGQYLQPRRSRLPVKRYWTPADFAAWQREALEIGFVHSASGPLVRSSYHADEAID